MITDQRAQAGSQLALLALEGMGLILLALLLFQIFWTGRGSYLLAAILAGVSAALILQKPHWGVLITFTAWFVGFSPRLFGTRYLSVPYLVSAVLIVPLALSVLRDRRIWVWRVPQVKIFFGIGILFLVSAWWAYYQHPITLLPSLDRTAQAIQTFFTRLAFLIFFLYFITTRRRIELTVWLVLGLIVTAAMTALFRFLAAGGVERAGAAFSLATNPNRLAFICLFATSLLWFYRCYGNGHVQAWKTLTTPILFVLPLVTLATGSRSGFLQLVILTALLLKEQEDWSAGKRVRSFFLLGTVTCFLWAAVPTAQFMRATTFDATEQGPGRGSLNNRINRITALLEIASSNPLLGIGIGNFRWMNQAFYGNDRGSHNSYLGALAEGGIGVLVLYLLLFYSTYRMLKNLERAGPQELLWLSKGLRVNLILFLVFSAFADFWLSDFLYLMVGLTVAMTDLGQRPDDRLGSMVHSVRVPT
ncbi:MAG: O-antigen ligase family protein [Candidatus Binatia bacterium]